MEAPPSQPLLQLRHLRPHPYLNLIMRMIILGLLVYLSLSFIPETNMEVKIKMGITLLVVVTYSVLDMLRMTVVTFKDQLCQTFC